MPRKTAGFVSKRPHKKSRAGCMTCKRKKVKCDEALPSCGYCAQRKLECVFTSSDRPGPSDTSIEESENTTSPGSQPSGIEDFNALEVPAWLIPASHTASGQLGAIEFDLINRFKTDAWCAVTVREGEPAIHYITREWVPQTSIAHSYLLNTIIAISASHSNDMAPSREKRYLADIYRQKAISTYKKALQTITNENYETLLVTAMYMQVLVPIPEFPCSDTALLSWIYTFFNMTQGLRVLASLKWAIGIENLSVFPLFRREILTLPPPPNLAELNDPNLCSNAKTIGDCPEYPNPPGTYAKPVSPIMDMTNLPYRPLKLMTATPPKLPKSWQGHSTWQLPSPAFLPPSLMAVLKNLVEPQENGLIDIHRPALLPVLHAFSPIFLSLYYYHLSSDFFVRISVLPTLFPRAFLALVKSGEPRALIVIAWWMAFARMLPKVKWMQQTAPRVFQAVSNMIMRSNNKIYMEAVEGAYRICRLVETRGIEIAARGIFDGWDGLTWENGPILAEAYAEASEQFRCSPPC
ncbi:hypothetical protein B0J11DRAFT_575093 [Dendryphion nanum]|uniref:Zn(2)-C6 fungal-type domain-containing protein n=1 Tax=Dendryphion nanum TaxID=256645 RepID=A0A9P9EK65_9PLEO|nr:hypothetical protein B0J11DRAFT_575093 [Dendryphion nanum]